jgi:perosamine synthetase
MIPVWEPVLDGNEEKYVLDCMRTAWISSAGEYLTRFETAFARWCGARHGVACSSGTTAVHLALAAAGIGPGDEVILPDFTLVACANMAILAGARPVLVDADPETWCLDPARIEERLTPRTRAILAVHLYGHPCDMSSINDIARRRGLLVVEDGAEAHGAEVNGRKVGSLGTAACFSFYGNKILTTGEGGMVVTDDDRLAERARLLRNQAFEEPRFVHREFGFNYRMTNVQAAIGLAQTEKADEKVARKREIARIYLELLGNREDVRLPVERPWAKNVYWMFGVLLGDAFRAGRDEVMRRLRVKGVDTRAFFHPLHSQPLYARGGPGNFPRTDGDFPVSDELWRRGLYLPSGLGLTRGQQEEVVARLLECR